MFKVLDLFSGAGGMSNGFEQTGKFSVTVAIENNPNAQKTYKKNHQNAVVLENVLEIKDYDEFKRRFGDFDVVIGGPPCQGFSNANRQRSNIISQNNALVKKYVEIIENLKPIAFVLENVSMIKSETHRFYHSKSDNIDVKELNIKKETLTLYSGTCPIKDIDKFLFDPATINELVLDDKSMTNLRTLVKGSYNKSNRTKTLEKKRKTCLKVIESIPARNGCISENYKEIEKKSLDTFVDYLNGRITFDEAEPLMVEYLNLQRLFSYSKELMDNEIVIVSQKTDYLGIFVEVESFTVIDYVSHKLGSLYSIKDDILNAAWYGAPQLRERYIALGIRIDISKKYEIQPELPEPIFSKDNYRTVEDAIKDLEDVQPTINVSDSEIDISSGSFVRTSLTDELRTTSKLSNHVITQSRETALQRFAALRQGENFHNLEKSLIKNTYTRPERTQNSIYLRLDYKKPSGTVTNVRKSMWIHPTIDRAISIREAARLQTFPDHFTFEGTKDSQYQQVGNAVPPIMAREIAKKLYSLISVSESVGV